MKNREFPEGETSQSIQKKEEEEMGKRLTLIRSMDAEEAGGRIEDFAKKIGREDLTEHFPSPGILGTLERDWLLQENETSPEINSELMRCLERQQQSLTRVLKEGDPDEVKETIEHIKRLLEKLERGVNYVQFGQEMKEGIVIDSTARFDKALQAGILEEAERWFEEAKGMEKYDDSWIDQQERKLFQTYYKMKDWENAKRIVESSIWAGSRKGRIKRLEELSGMRYEDI